MDTNAGAVFNHEWTRMDVARAFQPEFCPLRLDCLEIDAAGPGCRRLASREAAKLRRGTHEVGVRCLVRHRGREGRLSRPPLPPNRTGGFPAYGFPVSSCRRRIDRSENGRRADCTGPLSQRSHSANVECALNPVGFSDDAGAAVAEGDCGSSRQGL